MAIREATPIVVVAAARAVLEAWARAPGTEQRLVERARIVLAAGGTPGRAIARELGGARGVVSKWRVRFAEVLRTARRADNYWARRRLPVPGL